MSTFILLTVHDVHWGPTLDYALHVNLHFHTLVLDGVFTEDPGGALAFHPAPAPSDAEVAAVLATVRQRVQRLLVRHGLEPVSAGTQ